MLLQLQNLQDHRQELKAWEVWEECLVWAAWVEWACLAWICNRLDYNISLKVYLTIPDRNSMQIGGTKILASAKYVYLVAFFALLSGMFYPVITHSTWDPVISGTLILFVGLAGTVSIYKAATAEKHKKAYLIIGLAVTSLALFLVYGAIGRI